MRIERAHGEKAAAVDAAERAANRVDSPRIGTPCAENQRHAAFEVLPDRQEDRRRALALRRPKQRRSNDTDDLGPPAGDVDDRGPDRALLELQVGGLLIDDGDAVNRTDAGVSPNHIPATSEKPMATKYPDETTVGARMARAANGAAGTLTCIGLPDGTGGGPCSA